MKIGILYICTGNYSIFWDDFYLSCEKNFMPENERHYFVFTDSNIPTFDNPNVNIIHQEKLGWPFDTLKRFNMFLRVENELSEMDYLFFFNANIIVKQTIGTEILSSEEEELITARHPGSYKIDNPDLFSYDRNPNSNAFIPYGEGKVYVQGAFNGGASQKFLEMVRVLDRWTEEDLNRDVIALWHDESHLNKYILDKNVKVLHPGYIYPEDWKLPFEMIMMTRKKKKYGGKKMLRGDKGQTGFNPFTFLKKLFS